MEITKVSFYPYKAKKSSLKAFVSVEFDEEFVVTGMKLMDGKKGLFVAMPAQADSEGEYHDIAFPVTKEFRQNLVDEILDAWEAEDEDEKPKKKSSKKTSKKSSKKASKKASKKRKDDDEDEDEDDDEDYEDDIPF